jgi:hypothetical protein
MSLHKGLVGRSVCRYGGPLLLCITVLYLENKRQNERECNLNEGLWQAEKRKPQRWPLALVVAVDTSRGMAKPVDGKDGVSRLDAARDAIMYVFLLFYVFFFCRSRRLSHKK